MAQHEKWRWTRSLGNNIKIGWVDISAWETEGMPTWSWMLSLESKVTDEHRSGQLVFLGLCLGYKQDYKQ